MGSGELQAVVSDVIAQYWSGRYGLAVVSRECERYAFHASLVIGACGGQGLVCDVGGGWGALSAICARAGLQAYLVDDFSDAGFCVEDDARHAMPFEYGFQVVSQDAVSERLPFANDSFDVVSSFDSMEHWHRSPKRLFQQIVDILRPGGAFILGVPNCVNLRKRLTVPFGFGKWSSMDDWYEAAVFRGHVREPDVDDLRYIARDLGLVDVRIFGRNWAGLASDRSWMRAGTIVLDRALRLRPSLCSDIYLVGRKPGASPSTVD